MLYQKKYRHFMRSEHRSTVAMPAQMQIPSL